MTIKYEFKCPECNRSVESESTESPICCIVDDKPVLMKRVYALGGISFKGSGFFRTDNK